ncbi:hypothetical protein PSEUBRA_004959 [Kalmanozyma brasiliensis GHG001]|uniref:Uncharacterized protein n=1 Tax=Kalmanozyma brasiliensis (strain GHG001) TaxID=1365824 RepID=V5GIV1_KALBG|nr:uncharacterized protein PSEUBRA_004959 [Kalmanozyma brasiliensis GHG001]EST05912.1 hypothetical protein PSEUBRA_004959 [Kalmanozyma brasiliensis GHG001]
MTAAASTSALELTTLTLDHIVSDLESLPSNHGLFSLASTSTQPPSGVPQDRHDLLRSFESGTAPSSRAQYVELSHSLIAAHRTAQRLNSERVSASDVGLVLPSDRSSNAGDKATRTDLLHAKVASLQTQVDAWDGALQQAVATIESGTTDGIESIPDPTEPAGGSVPNESSDAANEELDDPWADP